jgi:flagellar assembly factor FliW
MLAPAAIADQSLDLATEASSATLAFPDGLVGCQDWKNFVLLTDDEENLPVACLQSLDQPLVRLLVTDPRLVDAAYAFQLSDADRASLDLQPSDTTAVYCTLTVGTDGLITANLLGPLVVNTRTRRGRQLVLTESGYSTRHPVAQLQGA